MYGQIESMYCESSEQVSAARKTNEPQLRYYDIGVHYKSLQQMCRYEYPHV